MRKPSIHIYRKDLEELFKDYGINSSEIMHAILNKAQENPVTRTALLTNKKTYDAIMKTHSPKVEQFNLMLTTYLSAKNFRGARQILKTDRQYKTLCQIAKDAEEFCSTFMLDLQTGMQIYIKLGVGLAGKNYALNKFLYYKEGIFNRYANQEVVKNDEHPEITAEVVQEYIKQLKREKDSSFVIKEFMHDFVYAAMQLVTFETTPYAWVKSQVQGLKSLEVVPEPYQIHGEGAAKRYLKHKPAKSNSWREKLISKKNKQVSS